MKLNGISLWVSRGITVSAVLTILGMMLAQSKQEGVQDTLIVNNKDRNTVMEERMEKREAKFDTFLLQQTELNTTTKLTNEALLGFLKKQTEFNGEVKEHLIRAKVVNP